MTYISFHETTIDPKNPDSINSHYSSGYVFTRIAPGLMNQTKSLRIDLSKFELTSENRRILRKTEDLVLKTERLPIPLESYDWRIHKMGKDFYATKFEDVEFSANKIKEILVGEHNFSLLFSYQLQEQTLPNPPLAREGENSTPLPPLSGGKLNNAVGYCVGVETGEMLHYCYPFYRLDIDYKNLGMGMMLKAILWAVEDGKKYVYLGSVTRESDKYKLQFTGLEMWENEAGSWREINI